MSLAALSMAHQNGLHKADALEHYQQVIPALKDSVQSVQDSYSDGALLTHFVLLLYEIAAAGARETNMWQHHSDQLLRIWTLRKEANMSEEYDSIIWSVFCIDTYALLSGSGTGSFAGVLVGQKDMLPKPGNCGPSTSNDHSHVIDPQDTLHYPEVVVLNQEVVFLAIQIGHLAQELRADAQSTQKSGGPLSDDLAMKREDRLQTMHLKMLNSKNTWETRFASYLTWPSNPNPLPTRVSVWVEHVGKV